MEIDKEKLLLGIVALISGVGSGQIANDLSDNSKDLIKHPIFLKLVIFCIVYLCTKDIRVSILVTIIYIIIVKIILADSHYFKEKDNK